MSQVKLGRAVLSALVLALAPGLAEAQDQGPERVAPVYTASEIELVEALHLARAQAFDLDDLPENLCAKVMAAATPESLELALGILEARSVPELADEAPQILSLVQEQLLLAAFAGCRPGLALNARNTYLARLRKEARVQDPEAPVEPAGAEAIMLATGAMGRPEDMQLLFTLAPERPRPGGAFERSLIRLLAAHPESFQRLRDSWLGGGDLRVSACISAVTQLGDPRALAFLEDAMRWSESSRTSAAAAVQALGRSLDPALNESLGLYLVDLLDPRLPTTCRAAAMALGRLGYEPALAPLVGLLEEDDARLREAALFALHRATGLRFGEDSRPWRIWLADEAEWLRTDSTRYFRELAHPDPAKRASALASLAERRTARTKLVARIEPLLVDPEPMVVIAACRALARLDRVEAVRALIETLVTNTKEVDQAAWEALVEITGLSLPSDPRAWRTAVMMVRS